MAYDKMVDSAKLNTDLSSVANAIRSKSGTSSQLSFPLGFIDAVTEIEVGGAIESLSVTSNGTYTAPVGIDGYSPVVVNVTAGGVLDELLEVKTIITPVEDVTQLIFPSYGNGAYFITGHPAMSSVDAMASGKTNIFAASEFTIYGTGNNLRAGVTHLYKSTGVSDYWGPSVNYTDETKTEILFKGSSGSEVIFLSGYSYYVLKVK